MEGTAVSELSYGRRELGDPALAAHLEWRVSNGIGGHASGTLSGALTRRHHGLLLAAVRPPAERVLLLAKLAEELTIDGVPHALDTNFWSSGAMVPAGLAHLERFVLEDSVPAWTWAIGHVRLEKRVWMEHGENTTVVHYRLVSAGGPVELRIHAFVNHRGELEASSYNGAARLDPVPGGLRIEAVEGATPWWLIARGAEVRSRNDWYREFGLVDEPVTADPGQRRDDHLLAAEIVATLRPGEDLMVVATTRTDAAGAGSLSLASSPLRRRAHERSLIESWRQAHPVAARTAPDWVRRLVLAADAMLAETPSHGGPPTVTPLGADSGDALRDTLIALPGLTVATGRGELARAALEACGARLLEDPADYAPDAPLWFTVAVRAYHEQTRDDAFLSAAYPWLDELASRLDRGAVAGASVDRSDGLLRVGEGPRPLTWTDAHARAAGIAPRSGKPVEMNALWFHMLVTVAAYARRLRRPFSAWGAAAERVERSFDRFFNAERGCLFDVLDGPTGNDASVRPHQILAVSLAETPLPAAHRRAVLETCGRLLLTSYGLRSLAQDSEADAPLERADADAPRRAAVSGDAWTWLLPHYALAHARVHGNRAAALDQLRPLEDLMDDGAVGYLPERTDGITHAPRGLSASSWAIGETLRAWTRLAGDKPDLRRRSSTRAPREQEATTE
jgi:glycogen debranching enzyme